MIAERKTPGALAAPGVRRRIAQRNRRSPATATSLSHLTSIANGFPQGVSVRMRLDSDEIRVLEGGAHGT